MGGGDGMRYRCARCPILRSPCEYTLFGFVDRGLQWRKYDFGVHWRLRFGTLSAGGVRG